MRLPRIFALVAVTSLAAAACGDSGGGDAAAPEEAAPPEDAEDVADIDAIEIDESVRFAGFSYDVEDMEVDESDVGALTFNVSVENLGPDTTAPRPRVALEWEDGDDVITLSTQTDFREVPSGSSNSGTIEVQVADDELERWDADSARLVFGDDSVAQAQVPLGSDGELTTREPISQGSVEGTFTVGELAMDILEAEVAWDDVATYNQVADGSAFLMLTVDLASAESSQVCIEARDYHITLPDGTRRTAELVEERCFPGGEDVRDFRIGFEVDDPFDGDYSIMIETRIGGDGDVTSNTLDLELVGGEDGTRTVDDDDDGEDDR